MRVKRFVANSMQEAIALVKADFGQEAVILHTKKVRRSGLLGFFRRTKVEVIAATDGKSDKRGLGPSRARLQEVSNRSGGARKESAATAELAQVRAELDDIKRALHNGPVAGTGVATAGGTDALSEIERILSEQEIHPDLCRELQAAVRGRATGEQLEDAEWLSRAVRDELAGGLVCGDPWKLGDEAKVQCLVGPTGVGKTTTIAKLAANYSLLGGKRVALITVDTYRIAAVEQLKTYAEIIGVPVDVAFTPHELKQALAKRQEYDMILVDTAGRSQKNKMQMAELRAFLEVLGEPQIHLVLSATTRTSDMLDVVERFGQLPVSFLIVTKLDETSTFGVIYNICRLTGKPLSYVTNGQNVPDDIEVAESEQLADMILGVSR